VVGQLPVGALLDRGDDEAAGDVRHPIRELQRRLEGRGGDGEGHASSRGTAGSVRDGGAGGGPRTFPPWRADAGPCVGPGRGQPQRGEGLGSARPGRGEGLGSGRGGSGPTAGSSAGSAASTAATVPTASGFCSEVTSPSGSGVTPRRRSRSAWTSCASRRRMI